MTYHIFITILLFFVFYNVRKPVLLKINQNSVQLILSPKILCDLLLSLKCFNLCQQSCPIKSVCLCVVSVFILVIPAALTSRLSFITYLKPNWSDVLSDQPQVPHNDGQGETPYQSGGGGEWKAKSRLLDRNESKKGHHTL